jgi:hypothetical protein
MRPAIPMAIMIPAKIACPQLAMRILSPLRRSSIYPGRQTRHALASRYLSRGVKQALLRAYSIQPGAAGGYYPELNVLIPLWHHAKESHVPAARSIPIRLRADASDGSAVLDEQLGLATFQAEST